MRGFPWIIALLASWLSLSQAAAPPIESSVQSLVANAQNKANYLEECTTHLNKNAYVEVLLYGCLSDDTMKDLVSALKTFSDSSIYTYNIPITFYLRIRNDCNSLVNCDAVDSYNSKFLHCQEATFPSIKNYETWAAAWPMPNQDLKTVIALCNDEGNCEMANQQAGPAPAARITVVDVRKLEPVGDPRSLNPRDITEFALCTNGAKPLAFHKNSTTQEVSCGCVCPPGSTKVKAPNSDVTICKPRITQSGICHTIGGQSYLFELTKQYATPSYCLLKGGAVLQKPTVHINIADNYVNYYDNVIGGPRIRISTVKKTYNFNHRTSNPSVKLDTITPIIWKEFARNPQFWLNQLDFSEPGLYTVTFDATDYFAADVCSFDVFVKDVLAPEDDESCPGTSNNAFLDHTYNYEKTVATGTAELNSYLNWINSIYNDKCGSNLECDDNKPGFRTQYMGCDYATTIPKSDIPSCYELKEDDFKNMFKECTRLREHPEEEVKEHFCKKCCHLDKQSNEKSVHYEPGFDMWVDECLKGPSCRYDGCVEIDVPHNFFTSSIEINDSYVEYTAEAVKHLNMSVDSYNPISDIHFINNCESLDDNPECRKSVKIQDLFTMTSGFTDEWRHTFGAEGTPDQYITGRYKVDGGQWNTFDVAEADYPVYELTRLVHTVDIEARTPCGVLITEKHYTIYQHPHRALALCYAIESSAFYQLSQTKTGTFINGELCSYPSSDFAEFSFTFDHKKADTSSFNGYAGYASFNSIKCTVRHGGSTGGNFNLTNTKDAVIVDESSNIVLEHYALRLLRDPKTAKYTPITVTCDVKYNGFDTYVHEETCSRSLSALDCDAPEISVFIKGDKAITTGTCASNCKSALVPNSVCGGNIIDYAIDNEGNPTTLFHSRDDYDDECCADCGSVKCSPVFDGSIGIKKCVLDGSTNEGFTSLFALPEKLMMNYNTVAFMTVGVAVSGVILSVGMIAVRYYRTRNTIRSDDKYSPLI